MNLRLSIRNVMVRSSLGRVLWEWLRTARRQVLGGRLGATFGDRAEVSKVRRLMSRADLVYEKELLLLPRLAKPGAVAVDIGANLGIYTVALSRAVGADGRVYSFEPGRRAFGQLRRMVQLEGTTNVTLANCAVTEAEGTARLLVPEEGLKFAHLTATATPDAAAAEAVVTTTLDAFLRTAKLPRLDLIKCDCEGGEYAVLRGAGEALQRKPVVIAEVAEPHCERFGYRAQDLFDHLAQRGFRAYSYDARLDRLVAVAAPAFDRVGHTWAARDGHLGNNNYVFLHSDRVAEFRELLSTD